MDQNPQNENMQPASVPQNTVPPVVQQPTNVAQGVPPVSQPTNVVQSASNTPPAASNTAAPPAQPPPPNQTTMSPTPQKKNNMKIPIIIGIVFFFIFLAIAYYFFLSKSSDKVVNKTDNNPKTNQITKAPQRIIVGLPTPLPTLTAEEMKKIGCPVKENPCPTAEAISSPTRKDFIGIKYTLKGGSKITAAASGQIGISDPSERGDIPSLKYKIFVDIGDSQRKMIVNYILPQETNLATSSGQIVQGQTIANIGDSNIDMTIDVYDPVNKKFVPIKSTSSGIELQ